MSGIQTPPHDTLYGVGVRAGIAIGRALIHGREERPPHLYIPAERVAAEETRFRWAVEQAAAELHRARGRFAEHLSEYAPILDSHILMLQDHMLYQRTLDIIRREGVNAEWALEKAVAQVRPIFESIEDSYLRARFADIEQVAERVIRTLHGQPRIKAAAEAAGTILVAADLPPEEILQVGISRYAGIILETGGAASHAAILARSLGITAILGVEGITSSIAAGDTLIMDGSSGRILVQPPPDQVEHYRELQRQEQLAGEQLALYAHLAAETPDGLRVRVGANIETAEEAGMALSCGAGGVGLFRSEYFYLARRDTPTEEELTRHYSEVLTAMAPMPVTIRTFDLGGDKRWGGVWHQAEKNPALGLRAIRLCMAEEELFVTQLRAILRASRHGRLRILFPMITSICELHRIRHILEQTAASLAAQGSLIAPDIRVGVMVEVPSAVTMADALAGLVDFFSIGTNDLIQYSLAVDRGNKQVAHLFEPLHPAVLRMLRQVVEAGHAAGIEVAVCGEMAGDTACVPVLLGLGLDELSMHPFAIPAVKRIIRETPVEVAEKLARELLGFTAAHEVRARLAAYLAEHHPWEFGPERLARLRNSCCRAILGSRTKIPVCASVAS